MSTADRLGSLRRPLLLGLLACAALGVPAAGAHPVSQGALVVAILPDRLTVRAVVSTEEVLVAAAHGGQTGEEALRGHGEYLRTHLRVTADGRRLGGRVVTVPAQLGDSPTYVLEYGLAGRTPGRLVLQQDVLREFEFAPGNPWEATFVVRVQRAGDLVAEGLLLTSREALVLPTRTTPGLDHRRLAWDYVRHGILHILSGYDHLLFVIALVLAVTTLWDLVKVVSAFTLAHSVTLALSVLNVVRLPGTIVEPMIAASVVVVALQNVVLPEQSRGAGRLGVAFFFGLFHGLGFAGGLLGAMEGMAGVAVGLAIVAFSAGVEIGHQLVVLPLFGVLAAMRRLGDSRPAQRPARVLRYGSAVVLAAGTVYLIAALA